MNFDTDQPKVAIVYHFFANYRSPILEELERCEELEMLFVADTVNRLMPGLETWTPENMDRFRRARNFPLKGGFMIQTGLIRLALRRDLKCIIFLGDWKWPATWVSAILSRLMGKRVLFWTHGWRKQEYGFKSVLRKKFYQLAHGMLLYGNRARQIGIDNGFDPDSLYVVYNSLDYHQHRQLEKQYSEKLVSRIRTQLFQHPQNPVIICSARLHARKRMSELLRAMQLLKQKSHPVNLILIGDGDDKSNLENLANELQLDVHFEGACFDENRIAELTLAANVTVSPGPIGLTVIQSLTFGVPVITNDDFDSQGPESEAIVATVTGEFFKNGSIEDLAEKIKNWTQSSFVDSETRRACMQVIDERYNPEYQVRVFERAVNGEKPFELSK